MRAHPPGPQVWLLRAPESEDPAPAPGPGGSVLDRRAQDRAAMALMGVKLDHSAGVREARPEDNL